ncbi:MAG: type II CAAX prenyl endopeptidase Rce1 family protein [Gemmatimonadales bacterium]
MRAILKALGAVAGFYATVAVVTVALVWPMPEHWKQGSAGLILSAAATVIAGLGVYAALARVGRLDRAALGWTGADAAVKGFVTELGLGVAMAAVALASAMLFGGARMAVASGTAIDYLRGAAGLLALLLVAALAEELLFRGYPLARLSSAVGKVWASLFLAVAFAAAHVGNPSVSTLGLVNIGLASLVLSAAFFTPGGLAAAWGLHWAWNAGLSLADAPVSGVVFDLPTLDFTVGGPQWFTGGQFGPEGGVVSSVVMVVALALLVWRNGNSRRKT